MGLENLNIFGTPGSVRVRDMEADRLGVITAVLERDRSEGPLPDKLDWLMTKNAPAWIVPCTRVRRTYKPGRATYVYTYEGAPPSWEFRDEDTVFELDGSMAQEPIQSNPNFQTLKKKYGWDGQRREFLEFEPKTNADTGIASSNKATQIASQLYGTDSWLALGVVYRRTSVKTSVPASILDKIGTVVVPPGIGNIFPIPNLGKRNWLKLAPKIVRRGNVVQISEEYMLSGPNGWNEDVYKFSQLAGSGGGGQSGLKDPGGLAGPL
jgi:hypothetical protein